MIHMQANEVESKRLNIIGLNETNYYCGNRGKAGSFWYIDKNSGLLNFYGFKRSFESGLKGIKPNIVDWKCISTFDSDLDRVPLALDNRVNVGRRKRRYTGPNIKV